MNLNTDYALSASDADFLKGVVGLPHDIRILALRKLASERGRDAVLDLFAQFIGLANSVVANNREMIEERLVIEGVVHPDRRVHINLPTIFGALLGVGLAQRVDQSRLCHGCAYRLASCANQSPATSCDAELALCDGEIFWCHEHLNADETPTRKCRGHLAAGGVR